MTWLRRTTAVSAILGAAALGALLPTAATASDSVAASLPTVEVESRAAGAVMLGGWVGGGILLLGTGILVASASARRPGTTSFQQTGPIAVEV